MCAFLFIHRIFIKEWKCLPNKNNSNVSTNTMFNTEANHGKGAALNAPWSNPAKPAVFRTLLINLWQRILFLWARYFRYIEIVALILLLEMQVRSLLDLLLQAYVFKNYCTFCLLYTLFNRQHIWANKNSLSILTLMHIFFNFIFKRFIAKVKI
jgi:hypothetical protein